MKNGKGREDRKDMAGMTERGVAEQKRIKTRETAFWDKMPCAGICVDAVVGVVQTGASSTSDFEQTPAKNLAKFFPAQVRSAMHALDGQYDFCTVGGFLSLPLAVPWKGGEGGVG